MFTYSDGTKDGFRERALVLDFFAQDDDGAAPEYLATHEAMGLDDEAFEDVADDLYNEGLLARDAFGNYGITSKGSQAHATAQSALCAIEAEINRQAFGETAAA